MTIAILLLITTKTQSTITLLARIFFCALLIISAIHRYHSQEYSYINYTVEDGLPSSEVYSAFQDSKGYMWFASDAGVSRFNGYEFENFDANDGLTDNTVFLINEDHKGRIWFGTFNCQLSYYQDGKIYSYQYNDLLQDRIRGKEIISNISVDQEDNVWLGLSYRGVIKIGADGVISDFSEGNNVPNELIIIDNVSHLHYGFSNPNVEDSSFSLKHVNRQSEIETTFSFSISNGLQEQTSVAHCENGFLIKCLGKGYFFFDSERKRLTPLKVPTEFEEEKLYSFYYDGESTFITSEKRGVFKIAIEEDSIVIQEHLLDGISVSRVYKDREGGYWFLTLEKGIFYFPSMVFKSVAHETVNERNIIYRVVADDSGHLFALTKENGVYEYDFKSDTIKQIVEAQTYSHISMTFDQAISKMIFQLNGEMMTYHKGQFESFNAPKFNQGRVITSDTKQVSSVNRFYLSLVTGNQLTRYELNKDSIPVFPTSLIYNEGNIWIGTNRGVLVFKNGVVENLFGDHPYLSTAITSLDRWNNLLLVGTKTNGLLIVQNNKVVDVITTEEGLMSDLVRKVHVDQNNTIWVGTNQGVSKINYKNIGEYEVYNLTQYNGLESIEIIDITSRQNMIILATPKGVYQFDSSKITPNPIPPPIYIKDFKVNSSSRSWMGQSSLNYNENFVQIQFEGLSYRYAENTQYQYRLVGVDSNWISTASRMVQFPTLQPNDYVFEVRAINEDGVVSESPATISFTIDPPIWKTWWFIVCEILLGLGVVSSLFVYRLRQHKKEVEANRKITEGEKKMLELELNALRAQMNPHFIFNTLNTIQDAINTLDKKIASGYIARFGRLIRIVLETSKESKILVSTEFELLALYIELESIRFSKRFSYQIHLDDVFEEEPFYIPSMVIQPFVENSILHGLVPVKDRDDLELIVSLRLVDDNTMVCTIEDNGIGREASAKLNQEKRLNKTSLGMKITKERLDLYHKENGTQYSFKIIDLKDEVGTPKGTKVEIVFTIQEV